MGSTRYTGSMLAVVAAFGAVAVLISGCGGGGGGGSAIPVPAPLLRQSPTPNQTSSPSPSPLPTATAHGTPGPSPTPTATPTGSPHPTPTPTATPTGSPHPTPTPTATPTATPHPTPTPTATPTATPHPTPTPTATPTPTPPPIQQKHVLTWGFLGGVLGTRQISWSQAAPHMSWAMTGSADSGAIKAVGIKTIVYTNPNREGPMDPLYTNDETTFAHDCAGHRLFASNLPDHAVMDMHSHNLWGLWQGYIQQISVGWGGVFDAYYDDAADSVAYATGRPCNFDQNAWTTDSNNMNLSTGVPIVYNGLELFSGSGKTLGLSPSMGLNATTIGGEAEGCYTSYNADDQPPHQYAWQAYENTEIAMYWSGKIFLCGGANSKAAPSAIPERLYQYASFLLTYNNATSMISEHFQTFTNFQVEPESKLVALRATTPEPSDISSLLQSSGVYGREFAACYIAGVYVGKCAAVVNSEVPGNARAFPWPGKYRHTLLLTGGGVLDGGTIATNGPPPPSSLDGEQAVIVFE